MNTKNKRLKFAIKNDELIHFTVQSTAQIKSVPVRLTLNGKIYELKTENKYSAMIYRVITDALKSEWYQSLSKLTHTHNSTSLIYFINWLNELEINGINKFSVLKDFESFQVNERGVKPQSTGLKQIINLLNQGLNEIDFDKELYSYIEGLLFRTSVSKSEPVISDTLTNYFSSIIWLRNVIGEAAYLKLESPKRLINSFSVTIATILLHLIEVKKEAKSALSKYKIIDDSDTLNERAQRQFYCGNLFLKLGKFSSDGLPKDRITNLLLLDFVPKNNIKKLISLWEANLLRPETYYNYKLNSRQIFTKAHIFAAASFDQPSNLEQILFSWLCSWQTVQPYDVPKLKKNDFIISKNQEGRVTSFQCAYYKGRSGRVQHPPMLDARQIEAQALIAYLDYFSENSSNLVESLKLSTINLTFGSMSITERLANLIINPTIHEEIISNLWKRKASSIFVDAFMGIFEKREYSYVKWIHKQKYIKKQLNGLTRESYIKDTKFPLPSLLFGLSSIKNSSVHAYSDRYRESDLINQNSHSSQTEKISYLTDANKDWVNQNGRITRLVLFDIEKYVYKPNIDKSLSEAHDLVLRTKVVNVLDEGISSFPNIKINSIGQVHFKKEIYLELCADPDEIIVLDTEETVVAMLHYINEATLKMPNLIKNALTFFEKTVLPNVEWMEYLISTKLNPRVVKMGKSKYSKLKNILPSLFLNEIRGAFE